MGLAGRSYALANYSAPVVAETHERFYQSVIDWKLNKVNEYKFP